MSELVRRLTLPLLLCFPTLLIAAKGEYAHVPLLEGQQSIEAHFNRLGLPDIDLSLVRCDNGKPCYWELRNHQGRLLKRYPYEEKHTVSVRASARYRERAYLLIEHGYACADDRSGCHQRLLFDDRGRIRSVSATANSQIGRALAARILADGSFLLVEADELRVIDRWGKRMRGRSLEVPVEAVVIGHNPDGELAFVAYDAGGGLWLGGIDAWRPMPLALAAHGDREDILGVYPYSADAQAAVVYRYVNEYHKGLYLLVGEGERSHAGVLYNSGERNIGFDPEIHAEEGGQLVVTARDGLDNGWRHMSLPFEEAFALPEWPPGLEDRFLDEKPGSLHMGYGLQQVSWYADSLVDFNGSTYLDVDYDTGDSLFHKLFFEGRLFDQRVALSYLSNRAEERLVEAIDASGVPQPLKRFSGETSSYLVGSIDFEGVLDESESLRVIYEQGHLRGLAEVRLNNARLYQPFDNQYRRYALQAMGERGKYWGGDLQQYRMPSAVGFSDSSKQLVYAGFDPEVALDTLMFYLGRDEMAYAKRYQTTIARPYWSWMAAVGLGRPRLSSVVERDALAATGASRIESFPIYIALGGELELGYLWQRRARDLQGLGYALNLGYRGRLNWLIAGQDKDDNPAPGTLVLEMERRDIMHGHFIQASILY